MTRVLFYIFLFGYQILHYCYADTPDVENVFVSILPQKYFVDRIGGGYVNVSVMVEASQSPEMYEPSPGQMMMLSEAQLYFKIGMPFEKLWFDVIGELNTDLKLIECCEDLVDMVTKNHHAVNQHIGKVNQTDPHVWTSPANAKVIALKIKNALVNGQPLYKSEFEDNYIGLVEDLNALDKEIKSRLGQLNNRHIIVAHPSWGYYAEAYNLIQIPIESDGKEIRSKSLAKLIEFARSRGINRIFTQKQFNKSAAEVIAREINAELFELNPLAEDYIANLRYVTDVISGGEN